MSISITQQPPPTCHSRSCLSCLPLSSPLSSPLFPLPLQRSPIEAAIAEMGRESLRTIAFAFRDIPQQVTEGPLKDDGTPVIPSDDLTLLAVMGIKVGCMPFF